MADSTPSIGPNFRDVVIKGGALRLSDDATRDTTDYVEILVGDGAPSGAYGRASGATMVYLRKDASSVSAALYITVDGGTTWVASQAVDAELTAIAGLTSAANKAIRFTGSGTAEVVDAADAATAIGGSTAAAGTTTADAGVLPAGTARVYPTTAADDVKGVRIHTGDKVTGRTVYIGNGVSDKILKVYPPSGGTINGAAADAAFSSASGTGVIAICVDAGTNTWLAW